MKRTISFGKVDFCNTGRRTNEVTVELRLEFSEKHNGYCFAASGNVWQGNHHDCIMCGQCLDSLYEEFESVRNNELFKTIHRLWKLYHLNDMHAGTPKQEAAIEKWKQMTGERYDYKKVCDYLKSINLYDVDINGTPYKYGHSWLYEPIPEEDLELIQRIIKTKSV